MEWGCYTNIIFYVSNRKCDLRIFLSPPLPAHATHAKAPAVVGLPGGEIHQEDQLAAESDIKIAITEEMCDAGIEAYYHWDREDPAEWVVNSVFKAMFAVYQRQLVQTPARHPSSADL